MCGVPRGGSAVLSLLRPGLTHTPDTLEPEVVRRSIPLRAVPLSFAAMAVPAVAAVVAPEWLQADQGLLLWLTPILPAFLLAYYRGWWGATLSLAFAMASLAVANVVLIVTDVQPPRWSLMFVLVVVYVVLALGVAALAELLDRERRAASRLAFTDGLTGLSNRREVERFLVHSVAAARRGGDLSVVLFDLDRFKSVNDRFGHAVGDQVLREFAAVLKAQTRGMDLSARFGGEEFLTVLPFASSGAALAFAERVRKALAAADLPSGPVTVSAGVASFEADMVSPDLLLAAADRALYAAKDAGRDRAVAWESPTLPHPRRHPGERVAKRKIGVLVVDDDAAAELSVARSLEVCGFRAWAAGGARGALRHFEDGGADVDVVLTDVVMPEMSGPTLVEHLERAGWTPAVIYVSGYLTGDVQTGLLPGGRATFVERPLDLDALVTLIREVAAPPTG